MKVAALQLDSVWEDKPANHANVRKLLLESDIPEDSLVILPEMFDSGFSMNTTATKQTADRESEAFLKQIAGELRCAVLAGVIGVTPEGTATNEAVAFGPSGEELVRYRKMQPFTPAGEDTHYGAGNEHRVFEWCGVKIAPFVCYDLRFPEIFRPAALDGAELITLIACWPEKRSEHWVRLLQARAIENQAFTIGVNRCGKDPSFSYDGRSCGWDPQGTLLFEASRDEQLIFCDIDVDIVRNWRSQFPALADCRHANAAQAGR